MPDEVSLPMHYMIKSDWMNEQQPSQAYEFLIDNPLGFHHLRIKTEIFTISGISLAQFRTTSKRWWLQEGSAIILIGTVVMREKSNVVYNEDTRLAYRSQIFNNYFGAH
jgi:hypothetical protein